MVQHLHVHLYGVYNSLINVSAGKKNKITKENTYASNGIKQPDYFTV